MSAAPNGRITNVAVTETRHCQMSFSMMLASVRSRLRFKDC